MELGSTLPTAYDSSVYQSTRRSPFKTIHDFSPHPPINLIQLSIDNYTFHFIESFAQRIGELHAGIGRKNTFKLRKL